MGSKYRNRKYIIRCTIVVVPVLENISNNDHKFYSIILKRLKTLKTPLYYPNKCQTCFKHSVMKLPREIFWQARWNVTNNEIQE